MAVSTEVLNSGLKNRTCRLLGVDDFELDLYGNVAESEVTTLRDRSWCLFTGRSENDRVYKNPVLRWRKNGNSFSSVLPIETKSVTWNALIAGGSYDIWDNELMLEKAKEIIEKAP